ncbi:hypothetical protein JOM56_000103, partial [Amanita muscaria]
HWAIHRDVWDQMQMAKKGKQVPVQQTLDGKFTTLTMPTEFTRDAIQVAVAQFVVCDDQSLAVASKTTFRNCLVTMRPKTRTSELPTMHDITTYIHNMFVKHLEDLKAAFQVC